MHTLTFAVPVEDVQVFLDSQVAVEDAVTTRTKDELTGTLPVVSASSQVHEMVAQADGIVITRRRVGEDEQAHPPVTQRPIRMARLQRIVVLEHVHQLLVPHSNPLPQPTTTTIHSKLSLGVKPSLFENMLRF